MSQASCPSVVPHDHSFGQGERLPQERRALAVAVITVLVMGVEIVAGLLTGSMALLADGVHMGTHALALGLAVAAYVFARHHATDRRFSFGTGKAGELAGFTSGLLLGLSALALVYESVLRLLHPTTIAYADALLVAGIGLVVNAGSALLLAGGGHGHHHHEHEDHHHHDHGHEHEHGHGHGHGHQDNNMRGALLHVLADALTSVAAMVALGLAWWRGWVWLDPAVALAASMVILLWAKSLLRDTGRVLLDMEAPTPAREAVRKALEEDGDSTVVDLHLWSVGPGAMTMVASVVTHQPREPQDYMHRLPEDLAIRHPVIEVRHCSACHKAA